MFRQTARYRAQTLYEYAMAIMLVMFVVMGAIFAFGQVTGGLFTAVNSRINDSAGGGGGGTPVPTGAPGGAFTAGLTRDGAYFGDLGGGSYNPETYWRLSFSGGTGPYSYTVSYGNGDDSSGSDLQAGDSPVSLGYAGSACNLDDPGSASIDVTVTDSLGASETFVDTMPYTCHPFALDSLSAIQGSYTPASTTYPITVDGVVSGGTLPYTFSWSGATYTFTTTASGTFELPCGQLNMWRGVTFQARDANGTVVGDVVEGLDICTDGGPNSGDPPSLVTSTISANPDDIFTTEDSTITVHLLDADGNNPGDGSSGGTVILTSSDPGGSFGPVVESPNNTYTATYTDSGDITNDYVYINATLDGDPLEASAAILVRIHDDDGDGWSDDDEASSGTDPGNPYDYPGAPIDISYSTSFVFPGANGNATPGSTTTLFSIPVDDPMPADWKGLIDLGGSLRVPISTTATISFKVGGSDIATPVVFNYHDWDHYDALPEVTIEDGDVSAGDTIDVVLTTSGSNNVPWTALSGGLRYMFSRNSATITHDTIADATPGSGSITSGSGEVTVADVTVPTQPYPDYFAQLNAHGWAQIPGSTTLTVRFKVDGVTYSTVSTTGARTLLFSEAMTSSTYDSFPQVGAGSHVTMTLQVTSGAGTVSWTIDGSDFHRWSAH